MRWAQPAPPTINKKKKKERKHFILSDFCERILETIYNVGPSHIIDIKAVCKVTYDKNVSILLLKPVISQNKVFSLLFMQLLNSFIDKED